MSADKSEASKGGVSKVKLALGAASLFLFIVGIKRTFKSDESPTGVRLRDKPLPEEPRAEREGRRAEGR